MTPIRNKRQNYDLWQRGAFGNKLRAWRSVEEWQASGFGGLVVLREMGRGGGRCLYNVEPDAVFDSLLVWAVEGVPLDRVMVNEAAPDQYAILQGEYDNELWGCFYYSRCAKHMRDALKVAPLPWRYSRAQCTCLGSEEVLAMTKEKLALVFRFYLRVLTMEAGRRRPCDPKRFSDNEARQHFINPPSGELAHLRFMCIEAQQFVDEDRTEKAMRWLGFLQGVLWARGFYSLDDLKNHSRPDGPI
jgi:hypothetical protein